MKLIRFFDIVEKKEKEAIEFIQKHEPPEGYFLGFSGGKDSVVLKHLTDMSGVKYKAYYSYTTIDPPEVVKFIRKSHSDVTFLRPQMSFYEFLQIRGFPTVWVRWCCDVLKKDPSKNIPLKNRLFGIRAEESFGRRKRGRISYFKREKQMAYYPLFFWLEWEIWDYIERYNLPYCSLYDEGFNRIGCIVCPFYTRNNEKVLARFKDRWPKQYAAFERAMTELFNNWLCVVSPRSGGYNFRYETDVREFIDNWYHGFMPKDYNRKKDYDKANPPQTKLQGLFK